MLHYNFNPFGPSDQDYKNHFDLFCPNQNQNVFERRFSYKFYIFLQITTILKDINILNKYAIPSKKYLKLNA